MTIIDRSIPRLKELDLQFGARATTLFATTEAIERAVLAADLVIGAVLVPGAAAPKLVTREMVRKMRPGRSGGHRDRPGRLLRNEPSDLSFQPDLCRGRGGALLRDQHARRRPRTSTYALTNATLPFVLALADKGWRRAMLDDPYLRDGLNIHDCQVTHPAVAEVFGLHHVAAAQVLTDGGTG